MWVKSAKAGFQKLYDVFEEKIYPKEKKELQEERICPFCGGELRMREFEIMNRW